LRTPSDVAGQDFSSWQLQFPHQSGGRAEHPQKEMRACPRCDILPSCVPCVPCACGVRSALFASRFEVCWRRVLGWSSAPVLSSFVLLAARRHTGKGGIRRGSRGKGSSGADPVCFLASHALLSPFLSPPAASRRPFCGCSASVQLFPLCGWLDDCFRSGEAEQRIRSKGCLSATASP
jgi:hypothetical protein